MKAAQYVKKYELDKDIHKKNWKSDLVKDLGTEFKSIILELAQTKNWNYERFKYCVNVIRAKFNSISNKRKGQAFTEEYWKYFYVSEIIPVRDLYFPEIKEKIEEIGRARDQKTKSLINKFKDFTKSLLR